MDQFAEEAGSKTMQKVASELQAMADDLVFITTKQL